VEGRAARWLDDAVERADVGEELRALGVVRQLLELVDGGVHGLHLLEAGDPVARFGLGAGLVEPGVGIGGLGGHRLRRPLGCLQRIEPGRLFGQLLLVLRPGFLLPQVFLVDRNQLGQHLVERGCGLGVLALIDLRADAVHQAAQGRCLRLLERLEFLDVVHGFVVRGLPRLPFGLGLLGLFTKGGDLAAQRTRVGQHLVEVALRLRRILAVDLAQGRLERRVHRVAACSQRVVACGLGVGRGVLQVTVDDALLLLERGLEVLRLLVGAGVLVGRVAPGGVRIADAELLLQTRVAVAHGAATPMC